MEELLAKIAKLGATVKTLNSRMQGLKANRDSIFEENKRLRAELEHAEKRIEVIRANRNDIFEENKRLFTELNEANCKVKGLAVVVENAEVAHGRAVDLCEQAQRDLKELRSEHEGKMDGYHEVVVQLQTQVRTLEAEARSRMKMKEITMSNGITDETGQPRSRDDLEEALKAVEHEIVEQMMHIPAELFVLLPIIRDVLREAIVFREVTEGKQIGWYNPDSKRFCYMDEKATGSETTQGYTKPVYVLSPE